MDLHALWQNEFSSSWSCLIHVLEKIFFFCKDHVLCKKLQIASKMESLLQTFYLGKIEVGQFGWIDRWKRWLDQTRDPRENIKTSKNEVVVCLVDAYDILFTIKFWGHNFLVGEYYKTMIFIMIECVF